MTFTEATKEILVQNGNLPMTSKEIWNKILQQNLVVKYGKTPCATLNANILKYSSNSNLSSTYKKKLFEIVGSNPMKYRLTNYTPKSVSVIIDTTDILLEEEIIDKVLLYQITSKDLGWKKISVYNHEENIEYEIVNCEGYTYIMEDKAHDTIKIGKTKNDPESRLNQLKTGNPSISLLHVFPSSQFPESELHERFTDLRKDLEWFYYGKGLKKFLTEEIDKHNSITKSYSKRAELDDIEKEMLVKFT